MRLVIELAVLALLSTLTNTPVIAQGTATPLAAPRENPHWVQVPTGDDVDRFYPSAAVRANKGGAALMGCSIEPDGRMANCRVYREEPEGYGFGAAVLKLSVKFRLKNDVSGTAGPAHWVLIPINFVLPGDSPSPDFQIGGATALVVGVGGNKPLTVDSAMDCLLKSDATHCQGHKFNWASGPDQFLASRSILKAGVVTGIDLVVCNVADDGSLNGCHVTSEEAQAVALDLLPAFKAPAKAEDGTLIGHGPIVIQIDWASYSKTAQAMRDDPALAAQFETPPAAATAH